MKKDHYVHVSEHFDLQEYHSGNAPDVWRVDIEGKIDTNKLEIGVDVLSEYIIHDTREIVLTGIPTEQLASNIISYIRATEILFL